MAANLIDECVRLWDWIRAIRPIRIVIATGDPGFETERARLVRRIGELENVEVLVTDLGTRTPGDGGAEPPEINRSDVVVFLAQGSGSSIDSNQSFDDFGHLMADIARTQQLRKRSLAYSLVRPFPDDAALLGDWTGDLDSLRRARAGIKVSVNSDVMTGVLADRLRRLFGSVWKGSIKSVEDLDRQIVLDVSRVASRLAWLRRGWRFLAALALVGLAGWLIVRYQLIGIIIVVAITGGIYLRVLDRRWD